MDTTLFISLVKKVLRGVFNNHYVTLSEVLKDCLKEVARELFANGLIIKAVKNSPTIDSICDGLLSMIEFKKENAEIEKHCNLFLKCIASQGGPARDLAETLAKEWQDEISKQLGIYLQLSPFLSDITHSSKTSSSESIELNHSK